MQTAPRPDGGGTLASMVAVVVAGRAVQPVHTQDRDVREELLDVMRIRATVADTREAGEWTAWRLR